jgi:hypothetical protein
MLKKENVFEEVSNPTAEQVKKALMIHCFMVEKRDGRIKARAVADGRSQIRYTEEEPYSPTVKLESIMLNAFIDAYEGGYVATVDIKGAFLKAKVPNNMELIVKITGELAKIMCEIDPDLKQDQKGVIYLKFVKALYGHIEATRLFYDDLNKTIQDVMGFKQNRYDLCVYNKETAEGTVTIRVHVDNLKISYKSKDQLYMTIMKLKEVYGEITVHHGNEHNHLRMILIYHPEGKKITLNMKNYVKSIIEEFEQVNSNDTVKQVKTPASNNLFRVRKENEASYLMQDKSSIFHSTNAKLLHLAKRGRPDILLAVSFLTTRVKRPDMDDWKKMIRVLGYLKETINFELVISCEELKNLTWYIDGSYAVYDDMKGQSGSLLMIGKNNVLSRSNKQKVNTRNSTETELIAVDDTLPTVQWASLFVKDQGYDLEMVVKEDNRSTMLVMKNGRLSSGKRTKHLDIRYFYIQDLLNRGVIKIEHCKTEYMIADSFTKPLQGRRFQVLRDIILNRDNISVS